VLCFYFILIPFDCFRDGSGLNALKIQKCLSEASFLNLAGRPETARLKTITANFFDYFLCWSKKVIPPEGQPGVWGSTLSLINIKSHKLCLQRL
jgi:hypothetical protein